MQSSMNDPVDLSGLAGEIAECLASTQPVRSIQFVIAPGVVVNGDRDLLQRALGELLGNAWKYSGKHVSARIEFGIVKHEGATACFVRDDGAGFDMTHVDKLFTLHHRLHSDTDFPGCGLGLVEVREIIRAHRGRVWAEGAVEQGATFYFTLWDPMN